MLSLSRWEWRFDPISDACSCVLLSDCHPCLVGAGVVFCLCVMVVWMLSLSRWEWRFDPISDAFSCVLLSDCHPCLVGCRCRFLSMCDGGVDVELVEMGMEVRSYQRCLLMCSFVRLSPMFSRLSVLFSVYV